MKWDTKWISVKVRLPSCEDDLLAWVETTDGGYVTVAWMHDDGLFVDDDMTDWGLPVTHWRPLPEPPED